VTGGQPVTGPATRDRSRPPTLEQRYVGAGVAALVVGAMVTLLFGLDGWRFYGLGLVAGAFAVGIAVPVLFTFGVAVSVLIDRALGAHPVLSVGAHAVVGGLAGALADRWFLHVAPLGAIAGLVAATVAVAVARRRTSPRAGRALVAVSAGLGLLGLAWLAVA
jgi:hypothetical protein